MSWQLTADRPIYLQLIEEIELRIVSGKMCIRDRSMRANSSPRSKYRLIMASCSSANSRSGK